MTSLDHAATALVAIDLQNGIVGLDVGPHPADDVVARTGLIADKLRQGGGQVIFVRVANAPDGRDALSPLTDNAAMVSARRPDGWADLAPGLSVKDKDIVVTKRQWGAFYGTELDLQLRRRGIRTIILTGIATNIGVESTAREAFERGFDQIFVEDAMSAMGDGHQGTVKSIFPRIGRVRSTDQVLGLL